MLGWRGKRGDHDRAVPVPGGCSGSYSGTFTGQDTTMVSAYETYTSKGTVKWSESLVDLGQGQAEWVLNSASGQGSIESDNDPSDDCSYTVGLSPDAAQSFSSAAPGGGSQATDAPLVSFQSSATVATWSPSGVSGSENLNPSGQSGYLIEAGEPTQELQTTDGCNSAGSPVPTPSGWGFAGSGCRYTTDSGGIGAFFSGSPTTVSSSCQGDQPGHQATTSGTLNESFTFQITPPCASPPGTSAPDSLRAGSDPMLAPDTSGNGVTNVTPSQGAVKSPGATARIAAAGKAGQRGLYIYLTEYSGQFSYASLTCTQTGATDQVVTSYNFLLAQMDVYIDHGEHRFTERVAVRATATGQTVETRTDDGITTYRQTCTDTQRGGIYRASRNGKYYDEQPGASDADFGVAWQLPWETDSRARYYFDGVPGGAPGVSMDCVQTGDGVTYKFTAPDGTSLVPNYDKTTALQWQKHELPACGGDYLTPNDEFFLLWDGATNVPTAHVGALLEFQKPFYKNFSFAKSIAGTLADSPQSRCSYSVDYKTHLYFAPTDISVPATTRHINPDDPLPLSDNKFSNVLRQTWGDLLGPLNDEPLQFRGQDADALFPGMNETGLATLDVSAQIAPSGHIVHAPLVRAASAGTSLYTTSFHSPAETPVPVTLKRTAAGARFLAAHPGSFPARFVATFKPVAGGKKITVSGKFTFPAS